MSPVEQEIFQRNYGVISNEEQMLLKKKKAIVIGCGGVGGGTLINLARMGIGHIHAVDMDKFEFSNINRQMLSSTSRVGKEKAICAKETLIDINPSLDIKITLEKMDETNIHNLIKGYDAVIDATDNLVSRVIIHRAAQYLKIPSVWIAVTPPFRGGVMCFSERTPHYEEVLRHRSLHQDLTPEVKKSITEIKNQRALRSVAYGALPTWADAFVAQKAPWAVLCPVANIVGLLASFEVFKIFIQRENLPPVYAPDLIKINLGTPDMVKVESSPEGTWDNADL